MVGGRNGVLVAVGVIVAVGVGVMVNVGVMDGVTTSGVRLVISVGVVYVDVAVAVMVWVTSASGANERAMKPAQ
jgi:hypothetical protein